MNRFQKSGGQTIVTVAFGLALSGAPVAAQQLPRSSSEPGRILELQAAGFSLIRPGLLGGAVGVVVGSVLLGLPLAHALEPTDDGLSTHGIIIGFQVGQALGIPTGVHLGSRRRSDYQVSLLISAAAAAVGTALLWTDDFDELFENRRSQIILVTIPLAQLIASIHAAQD
jgi:hypothetical protein